MSITKEKLYSLVKDIYERNVDAHKGFLKAAEMAKQKDIKLFFTQKAHHRGLFNDRLLSELKTAFNVPKMEGTLTETIQTPAWIDPNMFLDASEEAMLQESLRGDTAALKDYDNLLKHPNLPSNIRFIIKEQVTVIKLDRLKMDQLISFFK
ncbi:DUF2383 domain-containing protein [Confluentibacter sediminis]|uniref:DUF2383 domain-containing protein n=1 Tax=Confluentibacter sediminis TaxID=2219045 RepID=UPI000DAD966C|nr:DUF2383 domain-containing protein [Confluentibacter sediminis]